MMGTQTNQECDISMWAGKLIWKEAQFWNDYLLNSVCMLHLHIILSLHKLQVF